MSGHGNERTNVVRTLFSAGSMHGLQLVELRAKLLVGEVHEQRVLLPYIRGLVGWIDGLCLCSLREFLCNGSLFAAARKPIASCKNGIIIVRHVSLLAFALLEAADCEHINLPRREFRLIVAANFRSGCRSLLVCLGVLLLRLLLLFAPGYQGAPQ
jgi:hypothetical protein